VTQQLSFEVSRDGGRATVAISGDLDMTGTLRLEPRIDELIEDARLDLLVLDLGGVDFIDSVGLRLLVETHARTQNGEPRLAIVRVGGNVRRIFQLAGYEGVLPVGDDRFAC
jgi:anti-sigma B factor antagonist